MPNMSKINRKILAVVLWRAKKDAEPLVLCLQRPNAEGSYWQSVTGGVDEGEDFPAAALREVCEETGLVADEKSLRYLGLEYKFDGRWGPALERAFAVEIPPGGGVAPKITLDPKEHVAHEWLPLQVAMDRVKHPMDREAICRAAFPPSPLHLSREGIWSQDGQEITHERTVEFLHKNLKHENGTYQIRYGEETLSVEPEDAARFVRALKGEKLVLLDGREVALDPATLSIAKDHVLYCEADGERVRFLRSAYYELMKCVDEKLVAGKTQYILHWLGRDYLLGIPN